MKFLKLTVLLQIFAFIFTNYCPKKYKADIFSNEFNITAFKPNSELQVVKSNNHEQEPNKDDFLKSLAEIDSLISSGDFIQVGVKLKSLENLVFTKGDSIQISTYYSKSGLHKMLLKLYDEALEEYYHSLFYLKESNYNLELPQILSNMGTIYSYLGEHSQAKEFYLKALKSCEEQGLENNIKLTALLNLGGAYMDSGETETAYKLLEEGLILARKIENSQIEAIIYTNISQYFIKTEDWDAAILNGQKSLLIRNDLNMPLSVITLNNIGYANAQLGNTEKAIIHYLEALPWATIRERKQLFLNLKNAYQQVGDLAEALNFYERYEQVKDSIAIQNYEEKIAKISATYQAAEKEQKINMLEVDNQLQKNRNRLQLFLMIGSIIIILLAAGMVYMRFKNYRVKSILEKTLLKRQLLLIQLNPHFIFNALQSVQNFLYKNQPEISMQYLGNFSKLIRLVLQNSDQDLITLEDEIQLLDNYLQLQQLNTHFRFNFRICYDKTLELAHISIPAMMLQPFVENAIVHGVSSVKDGEIEIEFNELDNYLIARIRDNGKGFEISNNQGSNMLHKSMGIGIINKRIEEYNRGHRKKILMSTKHGNGDKENPGFEVKFKFPLNHTYA